MSMSACSSRIHGPHHASLHPLQPGRKSYLWISPRARIPAATPGLLPAPPLFAAMHPPRRVWAVGAGRGRWRGNVFSIWMRKEHLDLWSERPWRKKASRREFSVRSEFCRSGGLGACKSGPRTLMSSSAAPVPRQKPGRQCFWRTQVCGDCLGGSGQSAAAAKAGPEKGSSDRRWFAFSPRLVWFGFGP